MTFWKKPPSPAPLAPPAPPAPAIFPVVGEQDVRAEFAQVTARLRQSEAAILESLALWLAASFEEVARAVAIDCAAQTLKLSGRVGALKSDLRALQERAPTVAGKYLQPLLNWPQPYGDLKAPGEGVWKCFGELFALLERYGYHLESEPGRRLAYEWECVARVFTLDAEGDTPPSSLEQALANLHALAREADRLQPLAQSLDAEQARQFALEEQQRARRAAEDLWHRS